MSLGSVERKVWGICCMLAGIARSAESNGYAFIPSVPSRKAGTEVASTSGWSAWGGSGWGRSRRGVRVYTATLPKQPMTEAALGMAGEVLLSARGAVASSAAALASTAVRPAEEEKEIEVETDARPAAVVDPFRPARASVDPVAINILVKLLSSKDDAERVCNSAIKKRMKREETALTSEERRLIYKRVYGVEVFRERLAALLKHAVSTSTIVNQRFGPTGADFGLPLNATGDPMLVVNRAECLLALYMMTEEKVSVEFLDSDRLEVLVKGVGDSVDEEAVFGAIQGDAERLAARRSLPLWLAKRLIDQYGTQPADALGAKINMRPPTVLRVNTLKTTRDALVAELGRRGLAVSTTRYSPWGVTVDGLATKEQQEAADDGSKHARVSGLGGLRVMDQDVYRLGYVDLMNEASQCVALSTGVKPYDIVLVFGAKKGAKALALASMLRGNGMIYLWEPYERQRHQIAEQTRRSGTSEIMEVLPNINAAMRIKADVVLVDAVCSNTGALAHHPSLRWSKNETYVLETLVPQQRADLSNAARAVSPGGILVYSSCSMLNCENQDVANWFEGEFADEFEPLPFEKASGAGSNHRVLLPHIHGMDGTFVARWRRKKAEA